MKKIKAIRTSCCNLLVAQEYIYCPKCGKIINHDESKESSVYSCAIDLFDYATWNCSCGKGCERYLYNYCPMCGKNRNG